MKLRYPTINKTTHQIFGSEFLMTRRSLIVKVRQFG